ncbi:DUF6017 domain-containing protein [Butyrivibrio sp. INlla16]|uniref:DUF6017 domain-containing protein n=1 Tax=Butyrivibrio sp. INlla16 TaxID=1520807 RepID=UPI00088E8CB7|nr:DUF6017 domain-containing protein [Butyrivibrio sp. INlla16]SDB62267.1 hypothetical protein SAMN02910263_03356 [Butyrivibrio sp. INlla16]
MLRSSGNYNVDMLGEMHFEGNIIPHNWYHRILKPDTEKKKPYLLAIIILADFLYWYRPTEVRDQHTGQLIGYRKKFRGRALYRTANEIAEQFGETKRTVLAALAYLESIGAINRTLVVTSGGKYPYIELNANTIYDLTFLNADGTKVHDNLHEDDENEDELYEVYLQELDRYQGGTKNVPPCEKTIQNSEGKGSNHSIAKPDKIRLSEDKGNNEPGAHKKIIQRGCDESVPPCDGSASLYEGCDEFEPTYIKGHRGDTETNIGCYEKCGSNIENNTETISGESFSLSGKGYKESSCDNYCEGRIEEDEDIKILRTYEQIVRENISYESLVQDRPDDKDRIDDMVHAMAEIAAVPRKMVSIKGRNVPYGVVKSIILKLSRKHIEYTLARMDKRNRECEKPISSPDTYLISALYSNYSTVDMQNMADNIHNRYAEERAEISRQNGADEKRQHNSVKKKNSFCEFQQNDYDYDELEKMLVCN